MKLFCTSAALLLAVSAAAQEKAAPVPTQAPAHKSDIWSGFIDPVSSPTLFESPLNSTEIRPIFIHQRLHETIDTKLGKLKLGGHFDHFAVQLRYAFNEDFSFIATKDGYGFMNPDHTLDHEEGFANLALGVKGTIYRDEESGQILSAGLRVEVPTGGNALLQESGDGNINPFLSYGKTFGRFHVLAYEGLRIPFAPTDEATWNDASLHFDYAVTDSFFPLVEMNWHHVLRSGNGSNSSLTLDKATAAALGVKTVPVDAVSSNIEGVDLASLGTSDTQGQNYFDIGFGFRYKFTENLSMGYIWQTPLSQKDEGIFADRHTIDFIYKF